MDIARTSVSRLGDFMEKGTTNLGESYLFRSYGRKTDFDGECANDCYSIREFVFRPSDSMLPTSLGCHFGSSVVKSWSNIDPTPPLPDGIVEDTEREKEWTATAPFALLLQTTCPHRVRIYRLDTDGISLVPLMLPNRNLIVVNLQRMLDDFYLAFTQGDELMAVMTLALVPYSAFLSQPRRENPFFEHISATDILKTFQEESFCQVDLGRRASQILFERYDDPRLRTTSLGPLDYCNYERVEPNDPSDLELMEILHSNRFLEDVQRLTGLQLLGVKRCELRRISMNAYQIFNDRYTEPHGLDLIINFVPERYRHVQPSQDGATWFYLVDGEEVARVKPQHGTMSLAYRVDGCHRFMAKVCDPFEMLQLLITFAVIDS